MDLPAPEHSPILLAREPTFRLGSAEVRPGAREVASARRTETLEPRVMQVLVALARAEGAILTRDDLIASCWEGRAVSEDAITRVISRLRRLSEELGPDSFALETITKVGYRLLPAGRAVQPPPPASAAAPTPRPSRRWLVGGALAGGGVAAAGGAGLWMLGRNRGTPRARELYERATEAISKGMPADNAQAIAFLKEAVADSPEYADGWGALALGYVAGLTFVEPERQPGVKALAQAAARRALDLSPNQADALAALALIEPHYRNWLAAERRFRAAMARHPRDDRLEIGLAGLMLSVGRIREAVTAAEAAVKGDPFAPWYAYTLGGTLWAAGRLEEAERTFRDALKLWPRQHALWFRLFYMLSHTGRGDLAVEMASDRGARPNGVSHENVELHLPAAWAMFTRDPADLEAAAQMQLAAARRGMGYAENAIDWLCGLGHVDDAFRVARAMYFGEGFAIAEQRFAGEGARFMTSRNRNTHMLFMPPAAVMRADPRFAPLVRDIGLAAYWQASGKRPDAGMLSA